MGNNREPFVPDAVFHVYNHGNAKDLVFREDKNYDFFLKRYRKYIPAVADTFAYCLMPNHFHLMIRVKGEKELMKFFNLKNPQGLQDPEGLKDNLSNLISHQFGTLFNSYTKAYNKVYDRKGSLFRNTFHRKPVTNSTYYTRLVRYIHLNPVTHGFVEQPRDWEHSSYHSLLSEQTTALSREEVLDWYGGRKGFIKAHTI